jgi:hypothetical protein
MGLRLFGKIWNSQTFVFLKDWIIPALLPPIIDIDGKFKIFQVALDLPLRFRVTSQINT